MYKTRANWEILKEKPNGETKTVPQQALTLRQVVARHQSGQIQSERESFYDANEEHTIEQLLHKGQSVGATQMDILSNLKDFQHQKKEELKEANGLIDKLEKENKKLDKEMQKKKIDKAKQKKKIEDAEGI